MLASCLALMLALTANRVALAQTTTTPAASTPYLRTVRRYADTLLERGRDTYGPIKTHLILSALDRDTLAPLTTRPAAPGGIRESDRPGAADRPLAGANPQLDENLYRVLYTLSEIAGESRYADAADTSLAWFLKNTASPVTHLLPWGEHLAWDTLADEAVTGIREPVHEFARPWILWDRCFQLAPAPSRRFALALWEHQISDHSTGAFDRHAYFNKLDKRTGRDFPRHAGFYIRTWAAAYAHTQDATFLDAIETVVARYESKRHPRTGLINAWADEPNAWPTSELSLAIDCHAAAGRVPDPLASRLRQFAAREDETFLQLPHEPATKGFVYNVRRDSGQPESSRWPGHSSLWGAKYGAAPTGMIAMMCLERDHQTNHPAYRKLIVASADAYLRASPPPDHDLWPMTLGHAISTELAAYRITCEEKYLAHARQLADRSIELFWEDRALPRASSKTHHYEAITGADTLALALLELHAALHPGAHAIPRNTIDR
jgi:hypothetical protein